MKPKPFSIQHRLIVLQAFTVVLALWFIGAAIYINLRIRTEATLPSEAQIEQVAASAARLQEYTRILYLLLTAFALYAVLMMRVFRRAHRQHLWEPLGELHEMVRQVRKGNLDVQGRIPPSNEVGPLMESFLSLTAEVREMRQSLEQRVAERTAELEAAQKQLLQAAKLSAMGQLVSGVAHEVNNPLTSILGFSEVLLGDPALNPQGRRHLQTIREEALRLKGIVAGLSSFARRAPQRTAQVDVRRVLERLVDLRKYQLTAEGLRLHYEAPNEPLWVEGDADQLLQVFFNLVLNAEQAIQACRDNGDIWLDCRTERGQVCVTVRDNGTGMAPEVMERIFEPFFTTKPVGQGTGLGLSISHGIVEQHQGRIEVESRAGEGTAMRVALPAAAAPAAEEHPLPCAAEAAARSHGRALIIDDEAQIASLVQQGLERRGWTTVTVTDSTAVGSLLDGGAFDVVICDLKMPGQSGLDILLLLRKKRPELARRFLLMTGDLGDTDKRRLLKAQIPVLRKPFTLAQLGEAVQEVLRRNT